jgi:sulfur carrier protein
MHIQLNGESRTIDPATTVAELVCELQLEGQRIAVEINAAIVPRSTFANRTLQEGDVMEIVQAIGGG